MAPILLTAQYLELLQGFVEDHSKIQQHGYLLRELTADELLSKRRCVGCNKAMYQISKRRSHKPASSGDSKVDKKVADKVNSTTGTADPVQVPVLVCKYHPGEVAPNKLWTCCYQPTNAPACGGAEHHIPQEFPLATLLKLYQHHPTPPYRIPANVATARCAVALDCEMGTAVNSDTVLIRITMIDYFTGDVLIDNLVEPDTPLRHTNYKYSGITFGDLRRAKNKRTCLMGTEAVRRAIWKHVGPHTIVVGHGLHNDLKAIKWIHTAVVDTFVIESELRKAYQAKLSNEPTGGISLAAPDTQTPPPAASPAPANEPPAPEQKPKQPKALSRSLENLAKQRLGRIIQTKQHDSLEDALATRDLAHWYVTNPGFVTLEELDEDGLLVL